MQGIGFFYQIGLQQKPLEVCWCCPAQLKTAVGVGHSIGQAARVWCSNRNNFDEGSTSRGGGKCREKAGWGAAGHRFQCESTGGHEANQ